MPEFVGQITEEGMKDPRKEGMLGWKCEAKWSTGEIFPWGRL